MTGHTTGHWMDRIFDLNAMLLEQFAQIGEFTLRLRLRQTESRYEDDLVGIDELHREIVCRRFLHRAFRPLAITGGCIGTAEAAGKHRHERTVHGLRHEHGERHAGRTDEGASDDERHIVNGQAGHCDGSAGARIEHRDDHRHVGTADRNDEHQAVAQGEHGGEDRPQEALLREHAQQHE